MYLATPVAGVGSGDLVEGYLLGRFSSFGLERKKSGARRPSLLGGRQGHRMGIVGAQHDLADHLEGENQRVAK